LIAETVCSIVFNIWFVFNLWIQPDIQLMETGSIKSTKHIIEHPKTSFNAPNQIYNL